MEEDSKTVRQFAAIGKSTHDLFGGGGEVKSVGTISAVNEGGEEQQARNLLSRIKELTSCGYAIEFWNEGTACWCRIEDVLQSNEHRAKAENYWLALFEASRQLPV